MRSRYQNVPACITKDGSEIRELSSSVPAWRTAGHAHTPSSDKPRQGTDAERKIRALLFSKTVLKMLFSLDYHFNEFR